MPAFTLTDRYVDAAMRTVPEQQRVDLARELRASIDDQIDARLETGEERDAAERAVLTELGDPDKLAAGYTDRPLYLLGPTYYLTWWRLLKLLLWIVPASVAFAVALGQTLAGEPFGTIVGTTVGITIAVTVHLCFWTTVVFVIIERAERQSGQKADIGEWTLEHLPEPRDSRIRVSETVASVVMLAIGAGAIFWDRFVGFIPGHDIPVLDPGLWPAWIAALLVLIAVEAALNIAVYLHGRWTWGTAAANALLNVLVAGPALWLLSEGRLVNPELWELLPANAQDVPGILSVIVGFVIAGVAIWDSIDAFLQARRSAAARL